MKSEDVLSGIGHFFNDFVGAVVPGLVFLVLFALLHPGLWPNARFSISPDSSLALLSITGISFAAGHGLLGFYYNVMERVLIKIRWFDDRRGKKRYVVRDQETILAEATSSATFQLTKNLIIEKFGSFLPAIPTRASEVRNLAMTFSKESATLGRRFMFIALLGQATGAALVVLAIETALVAITCSVLERESVLIAYPVSWGIIVQTIILVLVAIVFFRRGDEFHSRAMKTPFSVAPVEIFLDKGSDVVQQEADGLPGGRV